MRFKENLSWLLILILFFLGGYLHGSLPFAKLKRLLNPDKQLRLLVYAPTFFPEDLITTLQKKSYLLRIDPVQQLDDLKLEILKSPAPDLILIPQHWVETLKNENLLQYSQNSLFTEFSADFSSKQSFFYPWFWFATKSFSLTDKPNEIIFAGDLASDRWIETLISTGPDLILKENKKVFLPHLMKINNIEAQFDAEKSQLWVLGWCIPKSADSLIDSLNLLHDLYEYPMYEKALASVPGASVLTRNNSESWDHWKKAVSLRELPFNKLKKHHLTK